MTKVLILIGSLLCCSVWGQQRKAPSGRNGWPAFGGGKDNIHYSSLKQINKGNVDKLRVAWTFDTGDAGPGSEMQCNPIVVEGVMYATTPKLRVIALDAATGKLLWSFEPFPGRAPRGRRNRGVSHWSDGTQSRVFFVAENNLFSLYASTGKPDDGFGKQGKIDLREGFGRPLENVTITATTPGTVYKDLLILGSLVGEAHPSAPGDIRAFDVKSGQIRWTFHTIPRPGEFGYDTWPKDTWKHTGGANNWAGMALDEKRGLIFVPTGSAAFDFYGADRHGDNLFANTLLCLKASTGERVWHFQAVKHDVWDRDFPSAPSLVTVRRSGKFIDAVAQITKAGFVFVFHRETGESLFPLQTVQAPASSVEGELTAKTQVIPLKPPPYARQQFTEDIITNRTPEAHRIVLERWRKLRKDGPFAPPSLEGTIVFPGFDGGGEWGGPAFDPETGLFYVNSNEMAWVLRLVPRATAQAVANGQRLYARNCTGCHGEDLKGSPPQFPSLHNLTAKFTEAQVAEILRKGAGRMPGFQQLGDAAVNSLLRYVLRGENVEVAVKREPAGPMDLQYGVDGYNKFLDPDGYPAMQPPWGTLNAIDLDKVEMAWKIPFGEYPALAAQGMKNTGTENYGGGIVTAGGLFFIGATNHDKKFHAYDKLTGKLLWETTLPAAGNATPAMYEIKGRQFIVIAAGGGKSGAPSGGSYVAFALPAN
ncbi:MAG: PQQ-binding-like beta-propeller repeat protein [Candidatus Solibacter usitatus]|nr:PQQ-binding-like beta-propeller repeat protein [Candidatus Solibacter usitatus]